MELENRMVLDNQWPDEEPPEDERDDYDLYLENKWGDD